MVYTVSVTMKLATHHNVHFTGKVNVLKKRVLQVRTKLGAPEDP